MCGEQTKARQTYHVATPVHPRVCGEQRDSKATAGTGRSSPRVRGTDRILERRYAVDRFIPACAGNSWQKQPTRGVSDGSSPRVRGTVRKMRAPGSSFGSSPRVRGTVLLCHCRRALSRFIPACAGNRLRVRPPDRSQSVHPRVCGEQAVGNNFGSSHSRRFIPACAGNSRLSITCKAFRSGSSPRVRGTAKAARSRIALVISVHPRVCGEQCDCKLTATDRTVDCRDGSSPRVRGTVTILIMCAVLCGSSPRVRGTVLLCHCRRALSRFIPACAGNSSSFATARSRLAVHPRVCGEQ